MTSKYPGIISNLLEQLHGHGYFRPEVGPLKSRLTEAVLSGLEYDVVEQLSGQSIDLEVSIGRQEGDEEVTIGIKVDLPDLSHSSEITLKALADNALEDLAGYLARLVESSAPAESVEQSKAVLRKKMADDNHEQTTASARLKVSPQWLKSVIPCTDYSYDEIDGKKIIREYYWSKDLIERLFKIKCTKTTPDDLQYVAKECCDGDLDWARDLIARLKSPNRAEPAPKDQPQNNQAKAQNNQPKAQQNNQAKAQQNNQAKAQQNNQAKAQQNNQAKAVPSERVRTRSRHKRPFREPGNDPARKPDAAGPKPPAN